MFVASRTSLEEQSFLKKQCEAEVPVEMSFCSKLGTLLTQRRMVVVALVFAGIFNIYAMRVNLSVGIVAMVTSRNVTLDNGTIINLPPDYTWTTVEQSYIVSAFFYGTVLLTAAGGVVASKLGGATVFGAGVTLSAICSLAIPFVAQTMGLYGVIGLKFLTGVAESVVYPGAYEIWARWLPPNECARLATLAFTGEHFGNIITLPLAGQLVARFGWPSIFYGPGVVALLWGILWFLFVRNDPSKDRFITKAELTYLESELGKNTNKKISHPWKKIFTCRAVWAIMFTQFCDYWGSTTLFVLMPTFLKDVWQLDIKETGFVAAIPYICCAFGSPLFGTIADLLRNKKILTITQVRRVITVTSFLFRSIALTMSVYSPSVVWSMVFLCAAATGESAMNSAYRLNSLDLAPRHASVLMGIGATMGCLASAVASFVAGRVLNKKQNTVVEWRIVYGITSCLFLVGALIYGTCSSAKPQKWGMDHKENHSKLKSEKP